MEEKAKKKERCDRWVLQGEERSQWIQIQPNTKVSTFTLYVPVSKSGR